MPYLKRWPHTPNSSTLTHWRAARDNAANQVVNVVYYGNSLTQSGGVGVGAVDGGYPSIVGNWMNAKLGKQHGVGFECARLSGTPHWSYTDNSLQRETYNPTVNSSDAGVIGHQTGFGLWSTALVPTDVLTLTGTMDRFTLLYVKTKTGGGTIDVRVDGALQTSINTLDAAQAGSTLATFEASNMWTSDAFANGSHTITLTNSGGDLVYIEGVYLYNTNYDSGFRFWNGAHSAFWGSNNKNVPNSYDIIKRLQPELAIWGHFYNDRILAGAGGYGTAAGDFIAKVREYSPNTDILICTEWQTQRWLSSHASYTDMRNAALYAAAVNNVGVIDLGEFIEPVGYNGAITDPMGWCMNVQPSGDREHQTVPAGFQQWAKIHWAYLNDVKPPSRPQGL